MKKNIGTLAYREVQRITPTQYLTVCVFQNKILRLRFLFHRSKNKSQIKSQSACTSYSCVKMTNTRAFVQNVAHCLMQPDLLLLHEKQRPVLLFSYNLKLSSLLSFSFAPPVSDSPSFSSAKLEEWSAINRTNFPPASSPLVNGMDKPHLEPEAKYTQVTNGHLSLFCNLKCNFSGKSLSKIVNNAGGFLR